MPPSHWALFAGAEPAGSGTESLTPHFSTCEAASGTECPVWLSLLQNTDKRAEIQQNGAGWWGRCSTWFRRRTGRTEFVQHGERSPILVFNPTKPWLTWFKFKVMPIFNRRTSRSLSYLYSSPVCMVSPSLVLIRVSSLQRTILNSYSAFVPHFQARHKIPYIFEKYPTEGEE